VPCILLQCKVKQGGGPAILCQRKSSAKLSRCSLVATGGPEPSAAVVARSESSIRLVKCHVDVSEEGAGAKILDKEGGGSNASTITCSNNTATASFLRGTSAIPGFRPAEDGV
jgi:hypothetical protein